MGDKPNHRNKTASPRRWSGQRVSGTSTSVIVAIMVAASLVGALAVGLRGGAATASSSASSCAVGSAHCPSPAGFRSLAVPVVSSAQPVVPRYFASTNPFNQPVAASATQVVRATSIAAALTRDPTADIYAYGEPVFSDVSTSTRTYNVRCSEPWGVCPLSRAPIPIPPDATPSAGDDHAMVIVNPVTHLAYEMWRASRTPQGGWSAAWGAVVNTSGPGVTDVDGGPAGTGSGISSLAGLVTIAQLEAGSIPHALGFSSSLTCGSYVTPADKSDGQTPPPGCIPEGARVQLNPSIDLAKIPGITPFELIVGRALQTYGAFAKDTGGASFALSFETPHVGGDNPYKRLGVSADYYAMPHLPWSQLRLVQG